MGFYSCQLFKIIARKNSKIIILRTWRKKILLVISQTINMPLMFQHGFNTQIKLITDFYIVIVRATNYVVSCNT